ncbi:predicted protein [Micromonas commoda]|uniref:RING-type domain-containing protein n=1 Tax=Micromonas commoda (strain RCC299 / NOUM17 / CCMP2709) TaxID=296587 RepID=C1E3L9_MICCC|nr:predicted protein [Micromonas commoda]ACO62573.1 predicted protein [Micromonas commoda]|eukprot:XP_002501315.1 predicted protein [Micromonas commoda]
MPCSKDSLQRCWEECECECYDDDGEPLETCECGHLAHQTVENGCPPDGSGMAYCPDSWCGNPDCKLTPCMMCGTGGLSSVMNCHSGLCSAVCAMTMNLGGPVSRAGTGDCPICLEDPIRLVKLNKCGHTMCYACRAKNIQAQRDIATGDGEEFLNFLSMCPMCRAPNAQALDRENPYANFREAAFAQYELRENRDYVPPSAE